jgi:hypothetical protein
VRGVALLGAVFLLVPVPAKADESTWSARVGWETTSLGDARPDGFGTSGGHTIRLGIERTLIHPGAWAGAVIGDWRLYGFERPGERTIGTEVDVGARIERTFDASIRLGALASVGAFRAPFATAIGPVRFLGIRPAFEAGGAYMWRSGAEVRAAAGCRLYSTLVWTGCSWTGSVSAGWSW